MSRNRCRACAVPTHMVVARIGVRAFLSTMIWLCVVEALPSSDVSTARRPATWAALADGALDARFHCLRGSTSGALFVQTTATHCYGVSESRVLVRWTGATGRIAVSHPNGPGSWETVEAVVDVDDARRMAVTAVSVASIPPTRHAPETRGSREASIQIECDGEWSPPLRLLSSIDDNIGVDEAIRAHGASPGSLDGALVLVKPSATIATLGLSGAVFDTTSSLTMLRHAAVAFHPAEGLFRWRWQIERTFGIE